MDSQPATQPAPAAKAARSSASLVIWVVLVSGMLLMLYAPMLIWMGERGSRISQLSTGGVLVLFTMAICVKSTLQRVGFHPSLCSEGLILLGLAIGVVVVAGRLPLLAFPMMLLSLCLALAALVAFLFGWNGVGNFMPALGGIFMFGLLASLVPSLDWPLRATAARYATEFLRTIGVPVQLALDLREAPEIVMIVDARAYIVATECNGFGLLVSAFLLTAILIFYVRLTWLKSLALLLLAGPIAIVFNFLRIVSIILVTPRLPIPYMVIHEVLGVIFYYLGLGLIWLIANQWRKQQALAPTPAEAPPAAAVVHGETPCKS